ncbi:MAG: bifunctional demethylmenaquinone methyltransferase/2-methoxy-6-polyprenyl-1,4-benzoquinol methylase UbiE [bacterium]
MNKSPSKNPDKIREMFDSIAGRYDLLNRVLSLNIDQMWRESMAQEAIGNRFLDVACGTGDVAESLARNHVNAQCFGIDFSRNMLINAREKTDSIHYVQGDALELPVQDHEFTTISCAFGVRNFADRQRAFNEFYRILTAPGRVLILEFFPPEVRWYLKPYQFYLHHVLPRIGSWVSGSNQAYHYLRDSVEAFCTRKEMAGELKSAGFDKVEMKELTMGISTLFIAEKKTSSE